MNPEDELAKDFEGLYKKFSIEDSGLDDYGYSTTTVGTDSGIDLGVDRFYKDLGIDDVEIDEEHNKLDEINTRLERIEKVLGIPADLKRNKDIEEKYPHIKKMAEVYELEVEKHLTLELLTPPPAPEEEELPF